jgi:hypothetical protein
VSWRIFRTRYPESGVRRMQYPSGKEARAICSRY